MAHLRQWQPLCLSLYRHCSSQKQKPVLSASSVPSSSHSNLPLTALPTPHHSLFFFLLSPLPLLMKTPRPPSPFRLNSNAGTGCVSAFLRRLLCMSLSGNAAGGSAAQKKPQPVSPSVVARMMGLDSMPVFPCTSPDSGRSLCEAPVFLRQENENFLVLSFVPEEKVERIGMKKCKLKKRKEEFSGGEETRNNRNNSELRKENSPEKERGSRKPCGIDHSNSISMNMPCCCHQNLSPVSVLGYPFLIRYSNSLDSEEEEIPEFQNPRRLSSKFENLNCTTSGFHLQSISSSKEPPTTPETSNSKPVGQDHSRNQRRIIELTEEEVKISAWMSNLNKIWSSEENREIAAQVAKKVLDLLLEETVSEISNSIIRSCS